MEFSKKIRQSVLPLALVTVMPLLAVADDDTPIGDVAVTMDSAVSIALEQVPGNVIGAELEQEDGKTLWEIEVVSADNKSVEVMIDAQTGAVIEVETDDD